MELNLPLSDRTRIEQQQLKPRIVELWKALAPLQTVVSFMNTGAHPDDETTAMLVALGLRDGLDISYACSTRGEGGQNDIGTESGAALGALRTAEMERACDAINLRMYWLSQSPDDSIFDFGFSKSGVETMEKWGEERVLSRFVEIVRTEKPDIICPTFLDIPGQHGHHRAMTDAAERIMDLSADPNYPGSDLAPWTIGKLYLPAWSGAGRSYDDDLPPPPTSLTIEAKGIDPVTGFSYEQIAQQSRKCHKTQAMGQWVSPGSERDWPLHLFKTTVSGQDEDLFGGFPKTLRDLGHSDAQDLIDQARASFPNFEDVLRYASLALGLLQDTHSDAANMHRIKRKREQLDQVIRIAAGASACAKLEKDVLKTSDRTKFSIENRQGLADEIRLTLSVPDEWSIDGDTILLEDAALSNPYPDEYLPGMPKKPCVVAALKTHGVWSETRHPFEVSPIVIPANTVEFTPSSDIINLESKRRKITVGISNATSADLKVPEGWEYQSSDSGFEINVPDNAELGAHVVSLSVDGKNGLQVHQINHPHTDPRAITQSAEIKIQIIAAKIPDIRVGYIGAGHDRVAHWLRRLGLDVHVLKPADLMSSSQLADLDTIVIGIFAVRFCDGLYEAMPNLHEWMRAGGTLLSLYHRPWDKWDPDFTPPLRLEIGQPSLRWRVTDETSEITYLAPHPIWNFPNKIGPSDWEGWHKERGLYFAKSWDKRYTPLIETCDAGEQPLKGALLTADIGKGRHTHCSLILHHQMEKLVPGAFRIFANLLSNRD
jgi:LmbE family N-acetylglucosaminyl deacetylase